MRFRPSLVPTIFVVLGLVILANLGLWQLRRNEQAQERLARAEAMLAAPPLESLQGGPEDLAWHRARLEGTFLETEPFLLSGRFEFGRPGFDVVHPFQVQGGPVLLVNRGWIPMQGWEEHLEAIDPGSSRTAVHGLLLEIEGEPTEPIAAGGGYPERWPLAPWASLAERAGDVAPVYLVAGDALEAGDVKRPEPLPVSGYHARPRSLPHMQYAITWFLIFGTLLVTWLIAGFRRGATTP